MYSLSVFHFCPGIFHHSVFNTTHSLVDKATGFNCKSRNWHLFIGTPVSAGRDDCGTSIKADMWLPYRWRELCGASTNQQCCAWHWKTDMLASSKKTHLHRSSPAAVRRRTVRCRAKTLGAVLAWSAIFCRWLYTILHHTVMHLFLSLSLLLYFLFIWHYWYAPVTVKIEPIISR